MRAVFPVMIVQKTVYARAGLAGNPSDGYFGKTVACVVKNFHAEVTLFQSPELKIEPNRRDQLTYKSMGDLAEDIRFSGYYGGVRLIKAAIKKFHEYTLTHEVKYSAKNFTIRYDSNIPMRVGLAGSSAIVTGTLLALMDFYDVEIPQPYLPTLVLKAESEELGIAAGLQDRVAQVYGGCVYMDFNRDHMEEFQYGRYEPIDPALLPPLFVAYRDDLSEGTEVVHNDLRERWNRGDGEVRKAMREFARIAEEMYKAIHDRDVARMSKLMNENFDLRASLVKISPANWDMINAARNADASAKFCGSGGAIVGICRNDKVFASLKKSLREVGAKLVKVKL